MHLPFSDRNKRTGRSSNGLKNPALLENELGLPA